MPNSFRRREEMDIVIQHQPEMLCVRLAGNFTFQEHIGFRNVLRQIGEAKAPHVQIDISLLDFVDSAALGMLLLARDEADKHKKKLVLIGARDQVRKIFHMAQFHHLFTMM